MEEKKRVYTFGNGKAEHYINVAMDLSKKKKVFYRYNEFHRFLFFVNLQQCNITKMDYYIQDLGEAAQAIRAKNSEVGHNFYTHITIDNATRLEDICLSYAATLYRQTELGKNWKGTDVTTIPRGAGYKYLRDAVKKVIDMFKDLCDEFILVGHVKDSITEKDGEEVNAKEIDLVGKLGKIICGMADAVGYVYRKGNETHISFKGGEGETIMEARARHIAGKDIVIATGNEDGSIVTYWDRIYKHE